MGDNSVKMGKVKKVWNCQNSWSDNKFYLQIPNDKKKNGHQNPWYNSFHWGISWTESKDETKGSYCFMSQILPEKYAGGIVMTHFLS